MRTIQPVAGEPSMGTGHWFPRTNTTSRLLVTGAVIPAVGAWSAAYTAQGPSGMKEIMVDIIIDVDPTAAGDTQVDVHFSDNNTTTPSYITAHPFMTSKYTAAAGTDLRRFNKELHIPLNSSGQFYIYCSAKTNLDTTSIYVTQKKYFC